ncbi:MAG: phosphate ABC transporter substrate-binding protein PstS [Cyanobacteria bacterium P01_A01_bin.80]
MKFSATVFNRVVTSSVVAAAVVFGPIFTAVAQAESLKGAGASFPAPLYQKYAREVRKKHPGLKVNYQACGSSCGIRQTKKGTVDFGGSDAAMSDRDINSVKRGVILVPTAGGAVSVVYNLPGVNKLKLSRTTLPLIFAGRITRWNDSRIKKDNPGVKLPNRRITPVVRADGSGTTFIFTNHLSTISRYFKGRVGTSKKPRWPLRRVLKGKGNAGVANLVRRTSGGIGYVNHSFAVKNKIKSAMVQNRSKQFVAPSLSAANRALASVKFPANYRVFVGDSTRGYPIVGLTWMMVYKRYSSPAKAKAVKKWINWVMTDGQKHNGSLQYTKIPASVRKRVLRDMKKVK